MNRRTFLTRFGSAGALLLAGETVRARVLYLIDAGEAAKISDVEWFLYDTQSPGDDGQRRRRCAVRVTTTIGAQGWADVSDWMFPEGDTARHIKDLLLGRDAQDREGIWHFLYGEGIPLGTLSAVDIALWDLHGRLAGKPVHALLGTQRLDVPAYVTTEVNLGDPHAYADHALACKEKGVPACKIRPYIKWGAGTSGLTHAGFSDRDTEVYRAVRLAVGDDYRCMADNHGTYTFDEALRVGRLLDELAYDWYESPMPESGDWLDRYAALARELKTPICAPETAPGSDSSRLAWIEQKACDICRFDVSLGGLTACLRLAAACEATATPLELHGLGPDSYPHLQLIAATRESLIRYFEMFSLSQDAVVLPGRATPEPVFDEQGCVAVPQTPGMGLELDWQYILAHRVQ